VRTSIVATSSLPRWLKAHVMNSERNGAPGVEAPLRLRTAAGFRVPSVLRCGAMIFALKAALRIGGFAGVANWIRRRVQSLPATTFVAAEDVTTTESAVATAAALYPGRALCLEQSLVLYYVLRSQGVAVKFRMGVQAHPFAAHAWVEYRGEVLNDVPEHLKAFAPLADDLP
jgi:hypothetical protein